MVDSLVSITNVFAKMFYSGSIVDKVNLICFHLLIFCSIFFILSTILYLGEIKNILYFKLFIVFGIITSILAIIYVLLPPQTVIYAWFAGDVVKLLFKVFL